MTSPLRIVSVNTEIIAQEARYASRSFSWTGLRGRRKADASSFAKKKKSTFHRPLTCALRSCAGNSAITVRVVVRCSFVGTPPDYYQRGSCVADADRRSAYTTSPLGYLICDEFVHAVLSIDVRSRVFLLFFFFLT